MSADDKVARAIFERLQRIETRVVRGFTELGVVVVDDDDWCRVDNDRSEIHLKGAARSIKSIQLALQSAGGTPGGSYDVLVAGEKIARVKV